MYFHAYKLKLKLKLKFTKADVFRSRYLSFFQLGTQKRLEKLFKGISLDIIAKVACFCSPSGVFLLAFFVNFFYFFQ